MKKLYQADRNAVGELLKITDLLNNALDAKKTTYDEEIFSKLDTDLTRKVFIYFTRCKCGKMCLSIYFILLGEQTENNKRIVI